MASIFCMIVEIVLLLKFLPWHLFVSAFVFSFLEFLISALAFQALMNQNLKYINIALRIIRVYSIITICVILCIVIERRKSTSNNNFNEQKMFYYFFSWSLVMGFFLHIFITLPGAKKLKKDLTAKENLKTHFSWSKNVQKSLLVMVSSFFIVRMYIKHMCVNSFYWKFSFIFSKISFFFCEN